MHVIGHVNVYTCICSALFRNTALSTVLSRDS